MNLRPSFNLYISCLALLTFLLIVLSVWFHVIDQTVAVGMLHEDGWVEMVSPFGYLICLAMMIGFGGWTYLKVHFPFAIFAVLFALRELDFDKRFTETGLLQSRIITDVDVTLFERVIGLLVLGSLLALIIYTVRKYSLVFLRRLRQFDSVALGVFVALGFMGFSKTIDGLGRKLEPFGIMVSEQADFSASVFEEVFELGIPLALAISLIAYFYPRVRS